MKTLFGFIGWILGMFFGFMFVNSIPLLGFALIIGGIPLGRYIGGCIEENKENERRAREERERRNRQVAYEKERKAQKKTEAIALAKKYPEATKQYFKQHWGIIKSSISEYDITDDKVDILLAHRYSYENDEQKLNSVYRAKIEALVNAQRIAEEKRREEERRAELLKCKIEEREKKMLISKASNWPLLSNGLHYNYLLNYYPTTCSFEANEKEWSDRWVVWHFKNTPGKTTARDYNRALDYVIPKIKSKLNACFGVGSLKYLTLVCIPASSVEKTKARFENFSEKLC